MAIAPVETFVSAYVILLEKDSGNR